MLTDETLTDEMLTEYRKDPVEFLHKELEAVLEHGKTFNLYNDTIISNILHVLNKCYNVDIYNLDRNNKLWLG